MSAPGSNESHARNKILIEIVLGFALVAIFLALKIYLESTKLGNFAEDVAYEYLVMKVSAFFDRQQPPVAIVNIAQIPGGKWGQVTSREVLQDLIVALNDQHPIAIAIDEDFSTNGKGWADALHDPLAQFDGVSDRLSTARNV